MKKIIKWLANISGVTRDIQIDSAKQIGSRMQEYSYWFTGGIMRNYPLKDVSNILSKYPEKCLNHGHFGLGGSQFIDLREELYNMSKEDKSVFDEK